MMGKHHDGGLTADINRSGFFKGACSLVMQMSAKRSPSPELTFKNSHLTASNFKTGKPRFSEDPYTLRREFKCEKFFHLSFKPMHASAQQCLQIAPEETRPLRICVYGLVTYIPDDPRYMIVNRHTAFHNSIFRLYKQCS